ncbi:glycosyltransferase family 32 protein [Pseudomonas libanensis]|uniref:glycosyltransferase family 32 protein n=1 Tax=Pseudomonas libanensis TaxID=75588 RepID=UPI0009EA591F|nr:DUF6543 domain-containing protein [Pseudomonas libanensis]
MTIGFPAHHVNTRFDSSAQVSQSQPIQTVTSPMASGAAHPLANAWTRRSGSIKREISAQIAQSAGLSRGADAGRSTPRQNVEIETYIKQHADDFVSPEKEISTILAAKIKQSWGVEVDPDKTYLVTFKSDSEDEKDVVEKITLTQAALKNRQDTPIEDDKGWFRKFAQYFSPLVYGYNKVDELIRSASSRQAIYREPQPPETALYTAATKVSIPVGGFKALVWDTERTQLYKGTLDGFWEKHTGSYASLSKIAFVKAINLQRLEGTLDPVEADLAQRALGPVARKAWSELTLGDFAHPAVKDPNLDMGLLSINGLQSTHLMFVTDRHTQLTLLYIPGNSSPIHRFDNPGQMRTWLAMQASDPVKRESLLTHFSLKDQARKAFSDGVRQTLEGLGNWSDAQASGNAFLSELNGWVPERFIALDPLSGDPFQQVMVRQKARSYSDADNAIVSDSDYTKNKIARGVEEAVKAAMFMTPLALVMPEVAIALDAFYLAAGATQVGIGIDDVAKGKASGTDRIVFGVLNAVPPLAGHAGAPLAKALATAKAGRNEASQFVAAGIDAGRQAPTRLADQRPAFLNPPQRINGQIGYPMSPLSPPSLLDEFTMPMDDVFKMGSSEHYRVFVNGYSNEVRYDVAAGLWRGVNHDGTVNDIFYWREGEGLWASGTRSEALAGRQNAPAATENKTVRFPSLPPLPSNVAPLPKVIHYFWAGNEMPEHLIQNILENSRKSPGYKSIVHVDANNARVLESITSALDHKVGGLEVHDLKQDEAFQAFNASQYAEMYQYFRSGQGQNLAASSDVMRVVLIKKHGGIYLDTDDSLTVNVGNVELNASPTDILMNAPVNYEPADFQGFNTSNFSSHADNPLLEEILEQSYKRFKENKPWLDTHRPMLDAHSTAAERQAYKNYEKKIFEITGPKLFADVLGEAGYGFFPTVNDLVEAVNTDVVLPKNFAARLSESQGHYMAMRHKLDVEIGGEHSMAHSR